jgi:hypothetical protein
MTAKDATTAKAAVVPLLNIVPGVAPQQNTAAEPPAVALEDRLAQLHVTADKHNNDPSAYRCRTCGTTLDLADTLKKITAHLEPHHVIDQHPGAHVPEHHNVRVTCEIKVLFSCTKGNQCLSHDKNEIEVRVQCVLDSGDPQLDSPIARRLVERRILPPQAPAVSLRYDLPYPALGPWHPTDFDIPARGDEPLFIGILQELRSLHCSHGKRAIMHLRRMAALWVAISRKANRLRFTLDDMQLFTDPQDGE